MSYVVQAILGDRVTQETNTDEQPEAVATAHKWMRDPCREYDQVRVLTIEGELVLTARDRGTSVWAITYTPST